jgi:serine/threonine-protein kinase ATR
MLNYFIGDKKRVILVALLVGLLATGSSDVQAQTKKPKPLMRDFMGINAHLKFKPELYAPTCTVVRNYHNAAWDLNSDSTATPLYPMTLQEIDGAKVDWSQVYGSWKAAGYTFIDACIRIESIKKEKWKNLDHDARAYGEALAKYFGPSSGQFLASAEIGNEPASWDDKSYRRIFENMAKGMRAGDPKLKIVTAAAAAGKPDKYSKSMECFKGLEDLYDVLNVHTYSMIEGWPTWRRVFPEHADIPYLKVVEEMIAWREANAPGKEIWVTEFGYDATSGKNTPKGDFAKWVSSTETEQAQWIVRSFLLFSAMEVDKAFMYYFNDEDEASFHASSGLTRNFVPKPAYYAMAHLRKTLGDYAFSRVVTQTTELCIYEYVNPLKPKEAIQVVWSPTGEQKETTMTLPFLTGEVARAERMPLKEGEAEAVTVERGDKSIKIPVSESPIYLFLKPVV